MDPRNRADEALARARARGAFVVTPDNATSPMDASSTVRIPREIIDDVDGDPDSTMVIAQSPQQAQAPDPAQEPDPGWPSEQSAQPNQAPPEYMRSQYMRPPAREDTPYRDQANGTVGTRAQQFPNPPR